MTNEIYAKELLDGKIDFGNDVLMFTHNDLDGVGCATLFKCKFGRHEEAVMLGNDCDETINNYLEELENYTDKPFIFIADIGVKPLTAERLEMYVQKGGRVLYLDHHLSCEWMRKYEWAIVDMEACGTRLFWKYVMQENYLYRNLAIVIDDYDRWLLRCESSKDLNRLYWLIGAEEFIKRFYNIPSVQFTKSEKMILDVDLKAYNKCKDKVEKSLKVYEYNGNNVGVCYCDQYISEIGNQLAQEHGLSAIALVDLYQEKISLRSVGDFNVSEIAQKFKGGGHKNASGITLKNCMHTELGTSVAMFHLGLQGVGKSLFG